MLRPGMILLLTIAGGLSSGASIAHAQPASAQTSPSASSPLAVEPKTNTERFEAVILMTNLGRYDLAARYFEQLVAADPSDEELLALRDQFGTTELYRLSRITELQPASVQLLEKVNAASRKSFLDPARIDRVLQELDKSPREREFAILELRNIGPYAVPRLLQHLGDPQNDQDRDRLVYILTRMGRDILPPMISALDAEDIMLKTGVLEVIGLIGDSTAVDYLWHPAFSPAEQPAVQTAARSAMARILYGTDKKITSLDSTGVAARLEQIALKHLARASEFETGEDGKVSFWQWDVSQGTVLPLSVSPEAAGNALGLRFARQALSFRGENVRSQAVYLTALLTDAGYRTGWENPLPTGPGTAFSLALTAGVPVLKETLAVSLEAGRIRAAETALTALALVGDRSLLTHSNSRPSPLVQGLNAADRRVQFAAAIGILQLEPDRPFAHSGRVVEILQQAINDEGSQRVIVIDPNIDRGTTIGTAVSQMGYRLETARTGKQGFLQAAARGDVALVMVHINSVEWELSQTLANFRADARTAGLPIFVYGPTYYEDETRLTISRTPLSKYVVFSEERAQIDRQIRPFLDSMLSPPLNSAQRTRRSQAAMYWMGRIAAEHRQVFDLSVAIETIYSAIADPGLAPEAIEVLAAIGTARAQSYLAETVVGLNNSLELREQAALALARHIRKHGVLLDRSMVAELKTLWSVQTDAGLQVALAAVVGTLQPSPAMIEQRLQDFPAPIGPATN